MFVKHFFVNFYEFLKKIQMKIYFSKNYFKNLNFSLNYFKFELIYTF